MQEAEDQLSALSSGLATVDQRVGALKEQLGQHTRDAAAIEMRLNAAADTLRAAQNLLDQLAHEYTAWECDVSNKNTCLASWSHVVGSFYYRVF